MTASVLSNSGILKCKKDKAYEGGQLCPACLVPESHRHAGLLRVPDELPCRAPRIAERPPRPNGTRHPENHDEDEEDDEEKDIDSRTPSTPWTVSMNMSDDHGNAVHLSCHVRPSPPGLTGVRLNQTEGVPELELAATAALTLACDMTRVRYEKLWKLVAYYSEVSLRLRRDLSAPGYASYSQPRDEAAESLYYTGVRLQAAAEPGWLLRPQMWLQLDRPRSTAERVYLSYKTHLELSVSGTDARKSRRRVWVMIDAGRSTRGLAAVLEGDAFQLACRASGFEPPSISWLLPDGSEFESQHGRFSVLPEGLLHVRAAQITDSGTYRCVARFEKQRIGWILGCTSSRAGPPRWGTRYPSLVSTPGSGSLSRAPLPRQSPRLASSGCCREDA